MTLELHLDGVAGIHQALTGSTAKMGIWAQATACAKAWLDVLGEQ